MERMEYKYIEKYKEYYQESGLSLKDRGLIRLVVILGTKCSLRCKDCNNLMPYFGKKEEFPVKEIIKGITNILDATKYIDRLELIGGEPLLCNNLDAVVDFCIKQEKIKKIEITTNGTIPLSKKRSRLFQNEKVNIEISNYGNLIDSSKVISVCKDYKINYKILEIDSWISSGDKTKRNRPHELLNRQYANCVSSYFCKTLYNDKVFQCARAASLYALGICEIRYLSVSEPITQETLFDFITNGENMACDFCDSGTDCAEKIQPAIQL